MNDLEIAEPLLKKALAYNGGTHSWQDVVDALIEGKMQLWVCDDSAAVTEILAYPQKKVLHVFLAGGKMSTLIGMVDKAKRWGKLQKCASMTISGRLGWSKVLSKQGWKSKMIVMEKDV